MRYLGDLVLPLPALPNGTTLDDNARDVLIAQVRALPLTQQTILVDVTDATDEGGARRLRRFGLGAAVGIAAGALATVILRGKKKR